jgi:aminoglycoside 6-adenylyltransferase
MLRQVRHVRRRHEGDAVLAVSDDPLLDRILGIVHADPRVRAVILSGSRADPTAAADRWRDHDLVFVVHDVAPFRADPAWVDVFGERTILQRPDLMAGAPPPREGCGGDTWLMLFEDGSRIDLTLRTVAEMASYRHDGPTRILVDLDGAVPAPPAPDVPHFVPDPPTAAAFDDVCNEFWWVAPYVAKGLARGETTYAHHHLDVVLRAQLLTVLEWEVAAANGFRRGSGKFGRDLRRLVSPDLWARLERTYAGADPEATWDALEAMAELFRDVATDVAERHGFDYPHRDDGRVTAHLRRVRAEAAGASERAR